MWGQPIRERNVAQQAIQPTDQEILVESWSGAALHVEESLDRWTHPGGGLLSSEWCGQLLRVLMVQGTWWPALLSAYVVRPLVIVGRVC